jgi:hypothetical protein
MVTSPVALAGAALADVADGAVLGAAVGGAAQAESNRLEAMAANPNAWIDCLENRCDMDVVDTRRRGPTQDTGVCAKT